MDFRGFWTKDKDITLEDFRTFIVENPAYSCAEYMMAGYNLALYHASRGNFADLVDKERIKNMAVKND